jgi:hypothetical protein
MSKIARGDLVKLFRRNIPGMGIALERVKDINEYAEFDLSEAFFKLNDRNHPEYFFSHSETEWRDYNKVINIRDAINETIMKRNPQLEKKLLKEFWAINSAHSIYRKKGKLMIRKPKVDFTLVIWTRAPSSYSTGSASYHKNKSLWTCTDWLKKI